MTNPSSGLFISVEGRTYHPAAGVYADAAALAAAVRDAIKARSVLEIALSSDGSQVLFVEPSKAVDISVGVLMEAAALPGVH